MADSFEINKILGAVLGTLLLTLAVNIFSGAIFSPKKPEKPGYDITVSEQPAAGGGAAAVQEEPIEQLLAKASPEKGASVAKKCLACHDFTKGGKWTIQELNTYLMSPRAMVPGTSMAFAGISKASDRADLIAYLNTLADNPAPLPTAPASDQPANAAKGQEGQPAAPNAQPANPAPAPANNQQGPAAKEQGNQTAAPMGEPKNAPPAPNAQPANPAPAPKQ